MPEKPADEELPELRATCYHIEIHVGDGTLLTFEVPHDDPRFESVAQAFRERGKWAGFGFDAGGRDHLHQFATTVDLRDPSVEITMFHDGGRGYTDDDISELRRGGDRSRDVPEQRA